MTRVMTWEMEVFTSGVVLHLCEGVWMYLTDVHFNINCVPKYKSQEKGMEAYIRS